MKITDVAVEILEVPVEHGYVAAGRAVDANWHILARIRTADGIEGIGYVVKQRGEFIRAIAQATRELGEHLIGMNVLEPDAAWEKLAARTDWVGPGGLQHWAIAPLDIALWDAAGKALGQPLYRIWGGFRDEMPVIGIGGYYGIDDQGLREEAGFFLEQGFAGMKFKVGGRLPPEDARRVKVERDYVGPDFILLCDANQGYTTREAIEFARLTEDVGLRWFEEPCIWYNDMRAMREVRLATGIPVAAGQSEWSGAGMRELMTHGSIDVSNFDASWGGGPTEWRRVAGMASLFGVEMAHHEEPQMALHLLASIPHATFVEVFTPARDPIFWNLLVNRPEASEQAFPLSDAPGFGWELDEAYIDKHKVV